MPACLETKVQIRTLDNPCDLKTRRSWIAEPWKPVLEYTPPEFRKDPLLRIIRNGGIVHPDEWPLTVGLPGDEIIFYRAPGEGFLISMAVGLILMGVSYGVQTMLAPSVKPLGRELKESPTYGWDAIFSTVAPGTPIPIVYGTHRVGGHIIQQYKQASSKPDDPRSSELNTLLALSAGPIEGIEDIRVNGNPIANLGEDVDTDVTKTGENHQGSIAWFDEIKIATTQDIDLLYDSPEVLTTDGEVDAFDVSIHFPAGLYKVNERGNYQSRSVQVKFDWCPVSDPTNTDSETITITDKTQNPFEHWYYSQRGLTCTQYQITVTRLTADDSDPSKQSQTQIITLNDVISEQLTYPGIALLGITHLPSSKLSGQTPAYSCLVTGRRVKVFTTLTDYTVQWSDNPAWCLRDYMLDPVWGLGAWITEANIVQQDFLDFAAWCDTMVAKDAGGELEKQFRLNLVIDGSMSVIDCLRQIAATGRAWILQRGDKWGIKIDKEENPVQFFAMGRVLKGSFSTSKVSKTDLANTFSGEFYNEDNDFEQDNLPKEDETLGVEDNPIEKNISLLGTTTTAQANRLLNYYMLGNRLVRREINFSVGAEALAMEAGDVFRFAHDIPGWGWSGRLLGVDETGTSLLLDRTVTLAVDTKYELTVIHPGTDVTDQVEVTSLPGVVNRISVSGDWTQLPVEGADYSLGPVAQSTVLYRALSVSVGPKPWQRKIRGREYNPAVYGTDLTVLIPPSVSRLTDPNRIPADVRDLRLVERQVYAEDGTLSCAIDCHFTLPILEGVHAEVYWREEDSEAWVSAGPPTSVGYFSITDNVESPGATYEISVVTVSANGNRKAPEQGVQATITTVGTLRQPDNVNGFFANRTLGGLIFNWLPLDPVSNFDLLHYELRNGPNWDSAILIGTTPNTTLETSICVSGTQTFLIRAVNTAGKYSALPTLLIMEVEGRIGENVIFTRTEETAWTGTRENFTLDSGKLILNTEADIVAWRGQQTVAPFHSGITPGGFGLGFRVSGSYTSAAFQVATDPLRCLISTEMELNQVDTSLYWNALTGVSWDSDFARSRQWSVAPEGRVAVKLEMRFSTTTSDDSAFGTWQERPQNIEQLVMWAQVRVSVVIKDPAFTASLEMLRVYFDVPDVTESGTIDTTATGTVAVTYLKAFNATPKVTVTILSATAGDDAIMTLPTKTGFTIEVKNGGSRVVRSVHYHAIGY
jgi:predicted phage tail protein